MRNAEFPLRHDDVVTPLPKGEARETAIKKLGSPFGRAVNRRLTERATICPSTLFTKITTEIC